MNRILVFCLLSVGMVGWTGCATKQYVRNQVAPLRNKTTDLDQRAVDNAKRAFQAVAGPRTHEKGTP